MGGGGGSRSYPPEQVRMFEKVAKDVLKDAAGETKTNVFISFVSEDLDDVNLLRGQAKNENSEIEFNDWSLKVPFDSTKADYIRNGIRERIRQSSVTIAYLSEKTAQSRWVDWEIRESIKLGKGVVAMYKGDKPPKTLPAAITEFKIPVVSWNHKELTESIADAKRNR